MNMKQMDQMETSIVEGLNLDRMKADARMFAQWERYTGKPAGEACADYILSELTRAGVENRREEYEVFRSIPVSASVTVCAGKAEDSCGTAAGSRTGNGCEAGSGTDTQETVITATAAVYSGEAKDLTGPLYWDSFYWDSTTRNAKLTWNEQQERFAAMAGKIVLTYDISFELYYEAARAGALGVVAVWPKDLHHHDTMGGVWGMPGSRDRDLYPFLPYVQILGDDALMLRDRLAKGPVTVLMNIRMDTSIARSGMPVAVIKGQTEKFVLLSGHYDSWYEGMTDNGAANILMLETARVLKQYEGKLRRGVVIAWWSGHSDARYSGSTWFCDHHHEALKKNCVAHINMDICGCRGSNAVRFDMTGMEGKAFNDEFLAGYNSRTPLPYKSLNRSSDETFWGILTPVSIAPQFYVDDPEKPLCEKPENILETPSYPLAFGFEGPFWWWHTKEDTIDKIGDDVLTRDCEIAARLVYRYAQPEMLPVEPAEFMEEMREYFTAFDAALTDDFDVTPVLAAIDRTERKMKTLMEHLPAHPENSDDVLIRTAGELTRLKFTYSDRYHHDYAVDHDPYGVFAMTVGVTRRNTPPLRYLMAQTDFIRQRNRMVGQLSAVCDAVDLQLLRWGVTP